LDIPEGRQVPQEPVEINEVGTAVEWNRMVKRVGNKQETLMKDEGLNMATWFMPCSTSCPPSELHLPQGHSVGAGLF